MNDNVTDFPSPSDAVADMTKRTITAIEARPEGSNAVIPAIAAKAYDVAALHGGVLAGVVEAAVPVGDGKLKAQVVVSITAQALIDAAINLCNQVGLSPIKIHERAQIEIDERIEARKARVDEALRSLEPDFDPSTLN